MDHKENSHTMEQTDLHKLSRIFTGKYSEFRPKDGINLRAFHLISGDPQTMLHLNLCNFEDHHIYVNAPRGVLIE